MGEVERSLRRRREAGGKSLAPFVTAGVTSDWTDYVRACADNGADAIEIGLPFSDPMLDGPVIQAASGQALARGVRTAELLEEVAALDAGAPLIVMTYSNIVRRHGDEAFCRTLSAAGVAGLIVPDTPVDEIEPLLSAARAAELELILLVAPSTRAHRISRIAELSSGFVYAVSNMGVTGLRDTLSETVQPTVEAIRSRTSLPVLVGFGISSPEQAVQASQHADGVVVASALMRDVLAGASAIELGNAVAGYRSALDSVEWGAGAAPAGAVESGQ
ncbi:MAG TPA: tryptophan synthase subunit alpha [Jatrophihabitans sp.]|jgi:tryptophan synthase alpha chain|uniref:tryptophan synthase subunit alpha n=1 Tax=Jatrophihabitans sp. TaxID=1932789 RepID=UPI002F0A66EF